MFVYYISGAGDFNGDGLSDMLVSYSGYSTNSGIAYVVYGQTVFSSFGGSNGTDDTDTTSPPIPAPRANQSPAVPWFDASRPAPAAIP